MGFTPVGTVQLHDLASQSIWLPTYSYQRICVISVDSYPRLNNSV